MKTNNSKILWFVRRNALYLILAACILAVGLSVTLMIINQSKSSVDVENPPVIEQPVDKPVDNLGGNTDTITPEEPDDGLPVQKPITFIMPVSAPSSIAQYSDSLVWCSTLGRFQAHKAVDFYAQEGTDVFAVYDGVVESVENSLLKGYSVTVSHGNGLKTVYNSLADGDSVYEGKSVKAGDIIGQVSTSNRQEYKEGAHLHFEVIENGSIIDPIKYLAFDEK